VSPRSKLLGGCGAPPRAFGGGTARVVAEVPLPPHLRDNPGDRAHAPAPASMIRVVSGVIIRGGRLLLTQRSDASDYPFLWESPGGKVEEHETLAEALRREIREEIGVDGAVRHWLKSFTIDQPEHGRSVRILFFPVDIGEQVPRAITGVGLGWFTADEMAGLSMCPGNVLAREAIADLMRGGS